MNIATKISSTPQSQSQKTAQVNPQGKSFDEILSSIQTKEIKFSKHAMDRLSDRNIHLTESDVKKIENAVNKAEAKGIKEALILMDDKIFVTSIKNRTVITASDENSLKDSVFTNIDGAVFI